MSVYLQKFMVSPHLKEFINDIFLLESGCDLVNSGMDIIEPNGTVKLIISLESRVAGNHANTGFFANKDQIAFVGMFDSPFEIKTFSSELTRIIIVEFNPVGSYRFINLNFDNTLNTCYSLDDICDNKLKKLEAAVSAETDVHGKVKKLQHYLQKMLYKTKEDPIFDYCIEKIAGAHGCISIKELEKNTGYSDKWLNRKFRQKLGVSPKVYTSIVRFNSVFKCIASDPHLYHKEKIYLDFYYDQPHFIKDFKRYSGKTPNEFYSKYGR